MLLRVKVLHSGVSQLSTLNQNLLFWIAAPHQITELPGLTCRLISFKLFLARKTGPEMDMYYVIDGSRHDSIIHLWRKRNLHEMEFKQ